MKSSLKRGKRWPRVKDALKSLAGRTILVTRASHQAGALSRGLEQRGATVLCSPAIAIESSPELANRLEAFACLDIFNWLIVTSQNGVNALGESGLSWRESLTVKCAVVGPKTEAAMRALGWPVHITAEPAHAKELLRRMAAQVSKDDRVLLLQGNQAPNNLELGLREFGVDVTRVEAYRTVPGSCENLAEFVKAAEAVLFTSGTTARYSLGALKNDPRQERFKKLKVFSIGPKTSRVLDELGFKDVIEAQVHTMDGLIDTVAAHYQSEPMKKEGRRDHDR